MQEIHVTDQLSFKTCRRRWNWSSRMRSNLEPVVPHAPFLTGRAVHYYMERKYRDHVDLPQAAVEFRRDEPFPPSSEQYVELAEGIMRHYNRWAKRQRGQWSDDSLVFVDMEHEFTVPLRDPSGRESKDVCLAGKFDGIIRNTVDNTLWLWEVKTARNIDERMQTLPIDEQTSAYLMAANKLMSEPVHGILYTILKKKLPQPATILERGVLAKRRHKYITLDSYINDIYAYHGQDASRTFIEKEYGEFLGDLLYAPNMFFTRMPVRRTAEELWAAEQDLYAVAMEMISDPPTYLHAGWHCKFCYFKDPCLEFHNHEERDRILATDYRLRVSVPDTEEIGGDDDDREE